MKNFRTIKFLGLILMITGLTSFSNRPELGPWFFGVGVILFLTGALYIRLQKS